MPTNVYFDTGTTSEQRLYEDLIIEQLKIYGQDVYYLPRKIANKDTIFGEDPASSFDDSYIIEMYVDNTDGYMGEQEIIKKFGLELRDDIVFTVSKLRWETLISNNADLVGEKGSLNQHQSPSTSPHVKIYNLQNCILHQTKIIKSHPAKYLKTQLQTAVSLILQFHH